MARRKKATRGPMLPASALAGTSMQELSHGALVDLCCLLLSVSIGRMPDLRDVDRVVGPVLFGRGEKRPAAMEHCSACGLVNAAGDHRECLIACSFGYAPISQHDAANYVARRRRELGLAVG